MTNAKNIFLVIAVIVLGALPQHNSNKGCSNGVCGLLPDALAETSDLLKSDLPTGNEQISFVELGSVNCIPCKQMQPIIETIEKKYAEKVKVVFHDVWTEEGKKYGNEYHIRAIPTQVFLDKTGKEITRHEGFFPQAEIEKILTNAGVEK
ncbi:MAG: thioredoxin family protein [Candidatus Omnitrophica bacterium]|nr:thioredoxin family protein [Candidatus Omnitrophota bacterium]